MKIDRRSFLKFMLATAAAEAVDFEQLLWTPKVLVTVPEMPLMSTSEMVAVAWEEYVGPVENNIFNRFWLLEQLQSDNPSRLRTLKFSAAFNEAPTLL